MSRSKYNSAKPQSSKRARTRGSSEPEQQVATSAPNINLEIKLKTEKQRQAWNAFSTKQIVILDGAAGTGKTKLACQYAAEKLYYKEIEKIYLTRPAVEAGEKLGFLPGEIQDKFAPYFQPFKQHFDNCLGEGFVDYLRRKNIIEVIPLAYCRGMTFGVNGESSIVILDEAQNTKEEQMKMFLTRMGENCKVFITGDTSQKDISDRSGLSDAIYRLDGLKSYQRIYFEENDSVRSELCRQILNRYK